MPATPSTSNDGQRRSARQRIDLSQAEEGFDRHQLELALRASFNEANKQGLFEDPSTSTKQKATKSSLKKASTTIRSPVEKRIIGKKEAKRIAARKAPPKKPAPKQKEKVIVTKKAAKIEKTKKEEVVIEEKPKEEQKIKTKPTAKKKAEPKVEKKSPKNPRTSDFITLLACAKKVLGDH